MRNLKLALGCGALLAAALTADAAAQDKRAPGSSTARMRSPAASSQLQFGGGPRRYSAAYGGTVGTAGPGPASGSRRKLTRNNTPVLSPWMATIPGFANSPAGLYFIGTLPQMEQTRNQVQTQQGFQAVQTQVVQVQNDFKSGLRATGHSATFGNRGGYFPGR